jgi:enoyl-CoA hydratase
MNRTFIREVRDFFWKLSEDRDTRVVIVRGAGRAFCAGLDLKEQGQGGDPGFGSVQGGLRSQREVSEIVMLMRRAPQPIIAAVHGPACGGGFAMALAADGGSPGIRAHECGVHRSALGVRRRREHFLLRIVGASVASERSSRQLHRRGTCGAVGPLTVVPDAELESAARAMAADMLRNSPIGLRLTKECLKLSIDAPSLEAAVAMEDRNQILAAQTSDFREGVVAFLQKRPATFSDG